MGFVDRVPGRGLYGGYGGYPSSPWSSYSNPYSRALALRGINPGTSTSLLNPYSSSLHGSNLYSGYGANPFVTSPWLSSPWLGSGEYGSLYASPLWGSPDWGVLPTLRSPYGYPAYGQSYWSSYDLDEWVDEPWEKSEWNPDAEDSDDPGQAPARQQTTGQRQRQDAQPSVPLVQNFNFVVPEDSQPGRSQNNRVNNADGKNVRRHSPLLKLAPLPEQQSGKPRSAPPRQQSPLHKKSMQQGGPQQSRRQPMQQPGQQHGQQLGQQPRNQVREKPCVTEFCGLKKPDMNGLWVAQDGEMLGVNGNKFLWGDTQERYLTGRIKIQNEYLLALVEGSDRLMRFKYKLAGDHLLTLQPDGTIREFIRISPEELYGSYYGGY